MSANRVPVALCRCLPLALLTLFTVAPHVPAADWKPADGPLLTRWAKDVAPDKVLPEYPRPQMVRKDWTNLNGLWDYALTARSAGQPQTYQGQILVPFPIESALSGVMKRVDDKSRLWYHRTFTAPAELGDKRLLLHFGAVDWETTVLVNGKEVGTHRGGYDGFTFDVTDALKKEGDQELVVAVWDPTSSGTQPRGKQVNSPSGIYYTPTTGIWQTVWLEPVPAVGIESLKIVPDLAGGKVRVTVRVRGLRPGDRLEVEARADGRRVARQAEANPGEPIELKIANPKPWSPETPFLYSLRVALSNGDKPTDDEVKSYFALRDIAVKKDEQGINRIHLNGKPYFQVGPLDQGFWPDGLYTAPTDEALKYDIEVTKKLGFNMARKHVKVEPERWYYWCDRLGLLVWQDMPSGDKGVEPGKGQIERNPESAKIYETELLRLLDGRGNHPCIVMWVPFNEGWGQFDTVRIVELVKKQDPSRLVDPASGWNDYPCGDVHDVHDYAPRPGSAPPEEKRAAVLGEFGGLGLGVDGHTWEKKTWGYQVMKNSAELTHKYERLLQRVYELKVKPGMSAAVYTQTTDVETETNGLMTYDRALIKVDVERVAAVNRGDFARVPELKVVVPTSKEEGQTWRYTLARPAEGWEKPDFADGQWKEGPGGFGTKGTPGAVVRTEWKTDDVWLRRTVTLPEGSPKDLHLLVHHDDDAEIYLNGVLAAKLPGFTTDYEEVIITSEALAALKPGKVVVAVHCHQNTGGQYIDVGFVELKERK